jgi:hypothetical protein
VLAFAKHVLKAFMDRKGMQPYMNVVYNLLKELILQLRKTPPDQLVDLHKVFVKPDSCIKKTALEFQAIFMARDADTKPASIVEFFEKAGKEADSQIIFVAFLYCLQGHKFFPDNSFWEWGDRNSVFDRNNERSSLHSIGRSSP